MSCALNKPEVGYFKSNILVTNQYGRSLASPTLYYVSPDENVYNFETFARRFETLFLMFDYCFNCYLCLKRLTASARRPEALLVAL